MKQSIAKQLAEASLPSPEQLDRAVLWDAIDTYLAALAHCPTCNGEGKYTTRDGYDFMDRTKEVHLPVGTELPCPVCHGQGVDGDHARWICSQDTCRPQSDPQDGHENCGWRLVFKIPDKAFD